jgi:hypothetical protein
MIILSNKNITVSKRHIVGNGNNKNILKINR